jgi:hypothetical protein
LTVNKTETVESGPLACRVTEDALRLVLILVELLAAVRRTVPLNPLTLPRVMLVEFENPAFMVRTDFEVLILKSTPVAVTIVETEKEGDVELAVTVITSLPVWDVAVTFNPTNFVPPAGRNTLVEFSCVMKHPQPVAACETLTVPWKPLTLVRVTVEVRDDPAGMERVCGLADRVKPSTKAVTVTNLAAAPVPAATVTV